MLLGGQVETHLQITIRREFCIEDALNRLSPNHLNFKLPLKVSFEGEQGIDEGGVRKEFF
jgi:hypothetical protein